MSENGPSEENFPLPSRNWNGLMQNKRGGDLALWDDTAQNRYICMIPAEGLYANGGCQKECQTSTYEMKNDLDYTAETPTWDSEFPSQKLLFQSLFNVTRNPSAWPVRGLWSWGNWTAPLCHQVLTPLPRCAYNLGNSCLVGIREFFGPWFYERQYFHNSVNVDIGKWLQDETNGTGTN